MKDRLRCQMSWQGSCSPGDHKILHVKNHRVLTTPPDLALWEPMTLRFSHALSYNKPSEDAYHEAEASLRAESGVPYSIIAESPSVNQAICAISAV